MAAAASLRGLSALQVKSLFKVDREERLHGACSTCIANGNADKQGASWQRRIYGSSSFVSRSPAQSSCWQRLKEWRRLQGSRLRAAADPEAEDVAAQGAPPAAGLKSFLWYEEAGLMESTPNLHMHERFWTDVLQSWCAYTATIPAIPQFSGSVRRASNATDNRNCWSVPDPAKFSLRSKSYPSDGGMKPAKEPFFTLVAVDLFKSDVRMDRLARRPGGLVNRTLKGGPPFVFVVNMQIPAGPVHYSMVYYFASYQPITDRMLFHAFMHGDDAYRDARLTLLPNIPNGSWLIRQSVGSRPVSLAQVLKCRYDQGEHFFEIDVDMGTSTLVRYVLSLVLPAITALVVDLAFLIRGDTEEELPEVLLGAVRLHTLELTSAIPPPPEA